MNRGFLMALLALDLFIMGTSAYVLWDRVRRHAQAPVAALPVPQAPAEQFKPEQTPPPAQNEPSPPALEEEAPEASNRLPSRKVLFKYRDSIPKRVSIVGTFNHWSPQLMSKDKNGNWTIILKLSPGEHAYNFIVDGKMIRDPSNKKIKKMGQKIPSSVLVVKAK